MPPTHPRVQARLRKHALPLPAAWGRNAPFLVLAGVEARCCDSPEAELSLHGAGRLAFEIHDAEVSARIVDVLGRLLGQR